MTDPKIALQEHLEKGSDATFLREMIGFAAERLMELETNQQCSAGAGGRKHSPALRSSLATLISTARNRIFSLPPRKSTPAAAPSPR